MGSLANVSVQYIAGLNLGVLGSDNTEVGFYTLALTLTSPLMMLPNVIGTTYYKEFAHQATIQKNSNKYLCNVCNYTHWFLCINLSCSKYSLQLFLQQYSILCQYNGYRIYVTWPR